VRLLCVNEGGWTRRTLSEDNEGMDLLGAIVGKDREALAGMVGDDVVLHSPGTTYRGREQVVDVLAFAPVVIAQLRATRDPVDFGHDEKLTFIAGRVEEEELDGVLIEARDEAGRIAEITMLVRPLTAVLAATRHLARALTEAGEPGA
jgi:hypothetical protein